MSTMPISSQRATQLPTAGMVDTNLEVVVIPVSDVDVSTLTELLRETEKHHGPYEASAPKHHWSGWYAAYPCRARARQHSRGGGQRGGAPRGRRRADEARVTEEHRAPWRARTGAATTALTGAPASGYLPSTADSSWWRANGRASSRRARWESAPRPSGGSVPR